MNINDNQTSLYTAMNGENAERMGWVWKSVCIQAVYIISVVSLLVKHLNIYYLFLEGQ